MNNTAVFEFQSQYPVDEKLASLLAECSNDNDDALTELYHLTAPSLYATQVRILGRDEQTERALHDTYLRIWSKSSEYSPVLGAPMPWLTSIARNHALNLKRASRASNGSDAYLDDTLEFETESEYIDTGFLAHNPEADALKRCLDRLDINSRDGIIRAYLDGWTLEELSEAYNKPEESLRESIHAAMLSLEG